MNPNYQEQRRGNRNQVTGKNLLIAVQGKSIQSHQKELIKETIIKFVDLNIKSIILASSDVKNCIDLWDELNQRLGINDASDEEVVKPRNIFGVSDGSNFGLGLFGGRKIESRLKVYFQPIELFQENESKFAENVRKHNKKMTISYIVAICDNGSSTSLLKNTKDILSRHVVLIQVIEDLKSFISSLNCDYNSSTDCKSCPENPDDDESIKEKVDTKDKIQTINLFLGHPIKLSLSAIPRLPLNLYIFGQFKEFFTNWIEFVVKLVTQIDTSTAANIVISTFLEQKYDLHGHQIIHSFYGHPIASSFCRN